MKKHESAGKYLTQYEDTDVVISDVTTFDGGVVFDLSDGTHWFSDDNDTCQVANSLTDADIGWDDHLGWIVIGKDGASSIDWL